MNKQIQKISTAMMGIVLTVSMLALPARADQPRMFEAREDLENAMKYLKKATADKGGHREQAIGIVTRAIKAVNDGIEYDRKNYKPSKRRNSDFDENSFVAAGSPVDQPNMEKARSYLNSALGNLNRASADKGGYRELSMRLVREAINEVNRGIEYDRNN